MSEKNAKFLRPFLERHPEYKFQSNRGSIHSTPVGQVLHGFTIRALSAKGNFYLKYYASVMIDAPSDYGNYSIGVGADACSFVTVEDQDYQSRILDTMERYAEILRPVDSFPALLNFVADRRYPHHNFAMNFTAKGAVLAAMGDFAAAKDVIARSHRHFLRLSSKTRNIPGIKRYYEAHRLFEQALDVGNPTTVFAILREWEATNVRENGFEPYWTPAPFPGEIALGLVNAP
jgi:hypothetical protein